MQRILFGLVLATALLLMIVVPAQAQEIGTTISGTVNAVTVEFDESTGESTVLVTLTNDQNETQTVRLSAEAAESLGLVILLDEDGDPATPPTVTVNPDLPEAIVVNSGDVLEDEEDQHPVGSALAEFFGSLFDVDYDMVMEYHEDGTGFGVIAQALWMTNALDGDSGMFQAILDAKKSGDYSAITLPDGSTPTNWGQFRKAVMDDKESAKQNLGSVMSGRAEKDAATADPLAEDTTTQVNPKNEKSRQGKGEINRNESDDGGGDNNNKDKNKDNGKGKGKDKGNGNGKNK